jgi:hypothetical protein
MSTKKILITVAIVGGIIIVAAVVGFGLLASRCAGEINAAKDTVGDFMVAAQARDIDGAYALCVPQLERSEIQALIEDNYESLFRNFENLHTSSWHIESSGGITTASLEGSVAYTGGTSLPYSAELAKTGGKWRIYSIYIGY